MNRYNKAELPITCSHCGKTTEVYMEGWMAEWDEDGNIFISSPPQECMHCGGMNRFEIMYVPESAEVIPAKKLFGTYKVQPEEKVE